MEDVEYIKTNGDPVLRKDVIPHLRLVEDKYGRGASGVFLIVHHTKT